MKNTNYFAGKNMKIVLLLLLFQCPFLAYGLDNGLALKPPMGWLSWERFTCNTDCKNDPDNCISERLYMNMADRLDSDGYKDVGYEYINIDDCWQEHERDPQGKLVADRVRFPNGIRALADYVHSKGLKLGIYQDVGNQTCAQYPGSYEHYDIDAATFAEWGVDSLKVDGCYADPKDMDNLYPMFSKELNQTGHLILFSCEWPFYQQVSGIKPDYSKIAKFCNMWRYFNDVDDSWNSILSIIDYYVQNQDVLAAASGPGGWNDPDMILAGNFGLSDDEAKAQFMLWAVMASPLLMSNDLRNIREDTKNLLKNKEIININQDPLGVAGKRILSKSNVEIWRKSISPVYGVNYSFAVLFFNRNTLGGPRSLFVELSSIGLDNPTCYTVYDVLNPNFKKKLCPNDTLTAIVDPSSTTMFVAKIII